MIIDTWIVVLALGIFVVMTAVSLRALWKCRDLEDRFWSLKDRVRTLEDEHKKLLDVLSNTNAEVEKVKGSIEALSLIHGKQLNDFERRLRGATEGPGAVLIKAINRLVEVVDNLCDRESEDWVGSAEKSVSGPMEGISEAYSADGADKGPDIPGKEAESCEMKDIQELSGGDTDGDSDLPYNTINESAVKREVLRDFMVNPDRQAPHLRAYTKEEHMEAHSVRKNDGVCYRWIFPDLREEPGDDRVFGQWYLVVGESSGKLKSDGSGAPSPEIWTEEAMWNGYTFVTKSGMRFDHVYAYIKPASSADIMEQVVQLALKKRAG